MPTILNLHPSKTYATLEAAADAAAAMFIDADDDWFYRAEPFGNVWVVNVYDAENNLLGAI